MIKIFDMHSVSNQTESELVSVLARRLDAASSAKSRAFWEKYLKGAIPFRGVPMGEIRRAVHGWWESSPNRLPLARQKSLALQLFQGRFCEDKLAGTLLLHEILLSELTLRDVRRLGEVFDRGLIADWNTCDWFCVKVLGSLVARDLPDRDVANLIASWCEADTLWKRRASNVAFVTLAKRGDANFPGFVELMLETCRVTVQCPERFAQTGVGWLLRELASSNRDAVLAFTDAHLHVMSREGIRYVVERMPKAVQSRILGLQAASRRAPHGDTGGKRAPRR